MNRSEIRTRCRTILAQTVAAASYYTDDEINQFINDGIEDACIKAEAYTKAQTIMVTTGVSSYYLPLDFLKPRSFLNASGSSLDRIELEDLGRVFIGNTKPISYYLKPMQVTFGVRLNSNAYIAWPTTASHSSTIVLPSTANGYLYECTYPGTSDSSAPTFSTTISDITTDGSVLWSTRSLTNVLQQLNLTTSPTLTHAGDYVMTYSAMADHLYNDTIGVQLPADKHQYLVSYAAFRCAFKAKQAQLAQALVTEYALGFGLKVTTGDTSAK